MDMLNLLKNRNTQTNIFILIVSLSLLSLFDTKTIISLIIIVLVSVYYIPLSSIGDTTPKIRKDIKKNDISDDMYYNNPIQELLQKISKFKKYNKISYKLGVKYLRKFFKTIHILEHDNIMNANQYFDNAKLYLKTSINHFQSITVSLPERSFIKGLKYGDFEATKKVNELGRLCKKLYNECYYILLNLSIKFNERWSENPTIYTREIDMNTDKTESYDKSIEINWSLY
jgi:hypothetical protein